MRLFVTSFVVLIAASGAALAQSVLERVLGQIDGATNLAQVNGVFANIAENTATTIPGTTVSSQADLSNAPGDTILWEILMYGFDTAYITVDDIGTTFYPKTNAEGGTNFEIGMDDYVIDSIAVDPDGSLTISAAGLVDTISVYDPSTDSSSVIPAGAVNQTFVHDGTAQVYSYGAQNWFLSPAVAFDWGAEPVLVSTTNAATTISPRIDASITNIITSVTAATSEAVAVSASATEFVIPTVDLGDLSTTGLGAVNTGTITLGVNSAVDEASTTTTRAISAAMAQIGGSADTGALILNVASNAGVVDGSIQNTMSAVNGSIGSASTTALGAVNSGTITSDINAAVHGIVGTSGQASSGL